MDRIKVARREIFAEQPEVLCELLSEGLILRAHVGTDDILLVSIEEEKQVAGFDCEQIHDAAGSFRAGSICFQQSGACGKARTGNRCREGDSRRSQQYVTIAEGMVFPNSRSRIRWLTMIAISGRAGAGTALLPDSGNVVHPGLRFAIDFDRFDPHARRFQGKRHAASLHYLGQV
jgi:hypothetical protein